MYKVMSYRSVGGVHKTVIIPGRASRRPPQIIRGRDSAAVWEAVREAIAVLDADEQARAHPVK